MQHTHILSTRDEGLDHFSAGGGLATAHRKWPDKAQTANINYYHNNPQQPLPLQQLPERQPTTTTQLPRRHTPTTALGRAGGKLCWLGTFGYVTAAEFVLTWRYWQVNLRHNVRVQKMDSVSSGGPFREPDTAPLICAATGKQEVSYLPPSLTVPHTGRVVLGLSMLS